MITINEYVTRIFSTIPVNDQTEELKQEIIQNMEEKAQDLINEGKEEEDAINKVIVEFGDIDEIRNEFKQEKTENSKTGYKKKKANYSIRLWYSIWASGLIIGLSAFINFYYSPNAIWFVYPTFLILWWPLSAYFAKQKHKNKG